MFEGLNPIIAFRMSERLLLTAIVIVVALVVLVGFWKTVQKITVTDSGPLGVAGSMALSTPVFALLAVILYAWVSLSHPISYSDAAPQSAAEEQVAEASGSAPSSFTGSLSEQSHQVAASEIDAYARQQARHQIWTLNCLADSTTVRPSAQSDLIGIKLSLMKQVWQDDWGNSVQFERWAQNPSEGVRPSDAALEVFEGRHTGC